MGHGLMIADRPTTFRLSLEVCARLGRWWDRDACRGGAFMENISSSYGFRSRWLKDDDSVYPCNWVADAVARRCYQIVTSRILTLVGDDLGTDGDDSARAWRRASSTCASSPSDATSRVAADAIRTRSPSFARSRGRFGGEGDCVAAAAYDTTANFTSGERRASAVRGVHVGVQDRCYYGCRDGRSGAFARHDDARVRRLRGAREGCRARGRVCPRRSREPAPRT